MKLFPTLLQSQRGQRPLWTVEVMKNLFPAAVSSPGEKGDRASQNPFPAVVVPLPRRPLFPGYGTSAFLKNQPSLARSLSSEKTVAAFMVKDATDYKGCILRPGLEGKDLLERLHSVGTLAEAGCPPDEANCSRVFLVGVHRVQMTDCVVRDDPLTVMVQPLEMKGEDDRPLVEMATDYALVCELFGELSGCSIWDSSNHRGRRYLDRWTKVPGFLPDFGPAIMPVLDKALHQLALEETKRSRRLYLTIEILNRELELDNMTRSWDLEEESCTEEEKEHLAQLRAGNCYRREVFQRGELPMAPSVGLRFLVGSFAKVMRPDELKYIMGRIKEMRLTEYACGY